MNRRLLFGSKTGRGHWWPQWMVFAVVFVFLVHNVGAAGEKSPKPRLVVGIVVEQMRYEYLYRYWDKFGNGGFKKMVQHGATCKNVHADYMLTQSSPGFATISTGTNPSSHGIVADEWYDRVKGKKVQSVADETVSLVWGSDVDNVGSPARLCATSVGDELRSVSSGSKVVSVALVARSAILLGGHRAQAAYWLDDITGEWVTSSYYCSKPQLWLSDFNAKHLGEVYLQKTWYPTHLSNQYAENLANKPDYKIGINNQKTFPYQLSALCDKYKRFKILKSTPQGNSFTKDVAIHAIVGEKLGKDDATDIMWVCFSSIENIGLKFGPGSVEMEDAFVLLDREIEFLIQFVENEVGKDNLLVFLTSSSGAADNTNYLLDCRVPAGQFKKVKAEQLLRSYLNAQYGPKDWISYFDNKSVYFNHFVVEDARVDLREMQQKSSDFLLKLTGVANVLSPSATENVHHNEGVMRLMSNSYNQKRSGDLLINLEPGWIDQTMTEATAHGSPYNYDTHVPLIWYGWTIDKASITRHISLADIAPTISMFLRVPEPNTCNGNPIWELSKEY